MVRFKLAAFCNCCFTFFTRYELMMSLKFTAKPCLMFFHKREELVAQCLYKLASINTQFWYIFSVPTACNTLVVQALKALLLLGSDALLVVVFSVTSCQN